MSSLMLACTLGETMSEYPHLCRECFEIGGRYDSYVCAGELTVMLQCPHCERCWSVHYETQDAAVYRDRQVKQ